MEPPQDWLELVKQRPREEPVIFDAVVDGGHTWLKVIGSLHQAVIKQIGRARWELGYADSDSEDDAEGGDPEAGREELLGSTDLFHHARVAVQAARWNHCHRLHFVLVNIEEGRTEDVDALLRMIRKLGDNHLKVVVSCANDPFITEPPPPLDVAIGNLLERNGETSIEDDYRLITPGVANLDSSVLLSLASDVLHLPVPQQPEGQRIVISKAIESQQREPREERKAGAVYVRERSLSGPPFAPFGLHKSSRHVLLEGHRSHRDRLRRRSGPA